ncbi:metal ABC transporter substrate-binding protein [Candidatus Arthromitus sp. SFB-rat-Yit]|uniref:metal ABC transporter substrate-binding protein n=1 Tax=Candidatus Arthromitus sp. SFB-rat-Yit TaxID=1041504 RepID=UPI000227A266|nr:metal ABC transporter substrate-binding protein [Candidatus Arthromitus sp. SFB-rat-Yit]BAK80788.1 manganese/zinc/iron chelate ABC transporter substrate-binding protein [Candidatus Arthromitus sp. SFB-rat-Yit]
MSKMRNIILGLVALLFMSCTSQAKKEGINVVTVLNPNYNLLKYIAQDKVGVYNITPSGDSHNFEFTPQDIKNIQDSDVVFYNGLGIDDKVLDVVDNKDKFVQTTKNSNLISLEDDHIHEDDHHHEDSHSNGAYDPHVWLSINEYKTMGKVVLDELITIDPNNKDFYTNNFNEFSKRIDKIYNSYINDFESIVNKEFVSNHASYGYLARDFGLVNSSLHDVNNHGEVNPKNLQSIVDIIRQKNIKLIIGDKYETNKELETISNETNITYKVVNNLENQGDYFTEYEELLSSIYDGLR